jgi:hypothetical protein
MSWVDERYTEIRTNATGFADVMPGTTRETPKGAEWVPKLAM